MSFITQRTSKKVDMVFVLALLTLFASTAFLLILIGAKQYKSVTATMTSNYDKRIASSYLSEKIRQNDVSSCIFVQNLMGTPALTILSSEGDTEYYTYIYYYENSLRELVVTDASSYSLSSGQKIMDLNHFHIYDLNDSLLCAEITNTDGIKQTLYIPLHCHMGKEAP